MSTRHVVVETAEGRKAYKIPPRVEVRTERLLKMPMSDIKKNEDIYRLAWVAVTDVGDTAEPFDKWIETVDAIDWSAGDIDAPLGGGQPSGTLSPPPSNPAQG